MENTDLIIKNLLQQSESDRIEFKTKASPDEVAKTVTAFINGHGGDLLLGVDEDRKVVGLVNAQQYRMDIRNYLSNHIVPTPPVSINLFIYHLKPLMIINAWEGAEKPYSFKQEIYHRVKGQNISGENSDDLPISENSKEVETKLAQIAAYIREKGVANTSDIVTLTHKSVATVKRYLKILKEKGIIHFVGSRNRKIGGYRMVD
jgi:predicted HTH transcriptional regulator